MIRVGSVSANLAGTEIFALLTRVTIRYNAFTTLFSVCFATQENANRMARNSSINELLTAGPDDDPQYVTRLVDELLAKAGEVGASDLHLHPTDDGLHVKWRIDGVLQHLGAIPQSIAENVVVRMKVMAKLLTYQANLPQEGRIKQAGFPLDVRVSTFPTVFGEKVVARLLPTGTNSHTLVADLGLCELSAMRVRSALTQTSGMLLIVGPAGSGKTTTAYACLREILASDPVPRNIASMEDPVESILEDVAQSEVAESVGFDLTSGLRSLVRQDPDVIFVGEIRDPATAGIAYQAALTGQLVITTFHAPDAATAVSRLADMGVPRYVLSSATNCVLGQQLIRRLCDCAEESSDTATRVGLDVKRWHLPQGCKACHNTGYQGRQLVAELLDLSDSQIAAKLNSEPAADELRSHAIELGMKSLLHQSLQLVESGVTSPAEVVRVFGIAESSVK